MATARFCARGFEQSLAQHRVYAMTALIDSAIHQLANGDPLTSAQLLSRLPEVAANQQGIEVLRLLLRLDRRVYITEDGKWALVETERTPEQRIVAATKHFLNSAPGGVGMLNTVVAHIANITAYDTMLVSSIVQRHFRIQGKIVFNQHKEEGA